MMKMKALDKSCILIQFDQICIKTKIVYVVLKVQICSLDCHLYVVVVYLFLIPLENFTLVNVNPCIYYSLFTV